MSDAALLAQGKALALVAAMLQRGGVISVEEFGNILGLFAVTVGETEPDEGDILALWAGIVRESAETPQAPVPLLKRWHMTMRRWFARSRRAGFADSRTYR